MIESNKMNKLSDYDTTINVIGGLRDFGVIYKAIASYFSEADSLKDLISSRNELNLRTERSRTRIEKAIEVGFLRFRNQDHEDLLKSFFIGGDVPQDRDLVLFWQFSLSNRLFREISSQVFIKMYFSGRTSLSKEDITAYLKEFLNQNKQLNLGWSKNTIHTLSTKYLNLMTKLNFLEGVRAKSYKHIRTSEEALVIFLYFAGLHEPENKNILKNDLLPLSFVAPEDVLERLKRLSMKGFFDMNFNGVDLNVELTHSYKGICDAVYDRSQAEIR
jgi:hypothetical protein